MNLVLTNFVEKPLAAVSNTLSTIPGRAIMALLLAQLARCGNSRNLMMPSAARLSITGGSSGTVRRAAEENCRAARWCWSHALLENSSRTSPTTWAIRRATVGPPTSTRAIYPT